MLLRIYERRWAFITKIHANLVLQVYIFVFEVFEEEGIYTPRRNDYIYNSLRVILCNGRGPIAKILYNETVSYVSLDFPCNGQPHELHTKVWLSKCNFLTRCGLHELYAMSRKLIPQECLYVCNVFEWRGKEMLEVSHLVYRRASRFCCFSNKNGALFA